MDAGQCAAMATAALAVLVPEAPPALAGSSEAGAAGPAGAAGAEPPSAEPQPHRGAGDGNAAHNMRYDVASPHSGWLTVLPLCTGFFDPLCGAQTGVIDGEGGGSGVSPVPAVRFGAAFWSNAPIDLPLASAEVHLTDGLGSFTAPLVAADVSGAVAAAPAGPIDLSLAPAAWLRLAADIPVRCSGEVSASAVVLLFGNGGPSGNGSSITFRLPELMPQSAKQPASATSPTRRASPAGTAPPGAQLPTHAVGWLRGGWAASQLPFSAGAG